MSFARWLRRPGRPVVLALAALLALSGCGSMHRHRNELRTWIIGRAEPRFDPDGPPDATRWALERLLSRGLLEQDSSGRVVPAAAESYELSSDGRIYTFHLRDPLRYVDGVPCGSADFRAALAGGLGRADHATRAWLLGALEGVGRVRAGRPLPALGIETPDARTLVLRLSRPDPLLPLKLALPGVSAPWRSRATGGDWAHARGLGPYRVAGGEAGRRLTLVRASAQAERAVERALPETLAVRFTVGGARVRALLRAGKPDLVWPLPPGLLGEPLPPDYRTAFRLPSPRRTLLLVMRPDLPPTSALAARHALAHGLNRSEILSTLGRVAGELREWLAGAPPFAFPRLDAAEVAAWMNRGDLGRSFHVTMAYDADGPGAAVARSMQGEWARLGLYVELRELRGGDMSAYALTGGSHLLLVESQPLLEGAAAELAGLVMPLRGPAIGAYRTAWRTRAFDPWIATGRATRPLDPGQVQQRLEEELVVLPLVRLPWAWVERDAAPVAGFHPRYGPGFLAGRGVPPRPNTR